LRCIYLFLPEKPRSGDSGEVFVICALSGTVHRGRGVHFNMQSRIRDASPPHIGHTLWHEHEAVGLATGDRWPGLIKQLRWQLAGAKSGPVCTGAFQARACLHRAVASTTAAAIIVTSAPQLYTPIHDLRLSLGLPSPKHLSVSSTCSRDRCRPPARPFFTTTTRETVLSAPVTPHALLGSLLPPPTSRILSSSTIATSGSLERWLPTPHLLLLHTSLP
jgi:hypothetical protein